MLPQTPIVAYGNIGCADEAGNWILSVAIDPDGYAEIVTTWIEAGATIVGGCCGTTPEHIRRLRQTLS